MNDTIQVSRFYCYKGIYKVIGDTLKVSRYNSGYFAKPGGDWRTDAYEIIDKNTLRELDWDYIYRFTPTAILPSPLFMKNDVQKWDNEDDWNAYRFELYKYLDREDAK